MTEDALVIEHEHSGNAGRYFAVLPDRSEAEMNYRMDGKVMTITHTGVPPAFEGRGIALKLVKAAIADARQDGFRIVPLCSYVALQFRRHPDWAGLLA